MNRKTNQAEDPAQIRKAPVFRLTVRRMFLPAGVIAGLMLLVPFYEGTLFPRAFIPLPSPSETHRLLGEVNGEYYVALSQTVGAHGDMMITLILGLFVLIGFVLREQIARGARLGRMQLLLAALFLVSTVFVVYFSHVARMQTIIAINSFSAGDDALLTTLSRQALAMYIAGWSAILLAGETLTGRRNDGEGGHDEAQPPDVRSPRGGVGPERADMDDS